jgi:hypothetical protein
MITALNEGLSDGIYFWKLEENSSNADLAVMWDFKRKRSYVEGKIQEI